MILYGETPLAGCRVCPLYHTHTPLLHMHFWARPVDHDRHLQGANYSFFDGHAKWFRYEMTLQPRNIWKNLP
ncbi:MAG: H-X9-DG-CTERM domain-containing protein [Candidatus Fervidibacter sp.]|uniref:H-X9-DG-CTERM domain-containing protein n=1 Tax=Candidatus Fervidibacter sp. TaxID=3100871 RepID=UPI004049E636